MFEKFKRSWDAFKQSRPGSRFTDYYERRQQSDKGRAWTVLYVTGGLAVIAIGVFALVAPGPGLLFIALGFGIIARESSKLAKAMDGLELRLRRVASWGRDAWQRASLVLRVLLAMIAIAGMGAAGYAAYRLTFGG